MNLLIKGISISLLSLIGLKPATAGPAFGGELGPVRPGNNYSASPPLAANHSASHYEGNNSWLSQEENSSSSQKGDGHRGKKSRAEENRLSPEQRRALRHEIKEVGRELYR